MKYLHIYLISVARLFYLILHKIHNMNFYLLKIKFLNRCFRWVSIHFIFLSRDADFTCDVCCRLYTLGNCHKRGT